MCVCVCVCVRERERERVCVKTAKHLKSLTRYRNFKENY